MKVLGLPLVLLLVGIGSAQDQFPDVPELYVGQTAKDFVNRLLKSGVALPPPPGYMKVSDLTRYEMAVIDYQAYQTVMQPATRARLAPNFDSIVGDVTRLTALLEKELISLGVDPAKMKLDLYRLTHFGPFPDVPADHWAADAIRHLKAEDLLKGYPDGRFHGSDRRPLR